ncbi:MAG: BppU family phage baseplate upper protein [Bacteroidales bacterium]|nr:BppU family phage baseplate upper protein [Bacteroidales bacterium]
MATELRIKRGTIYTATLTITNSVTGLPYDITGKTVFFTVKKPGEHNATDDSTYIIKKDLTTHSDPTSGNTTLSLTATDTLVNAGTYVWDCKVSGTNLNTDSGICIIEDTVTKRTS